MGVMGMSENVQYDVMQLVAGLLHMGNISFFEQGNYAKISSDDCE